MSMQSHLAELEKKHQALEQEINECLTHPAVDDPGPRRRRPRGPARRTGRSSGGTMTTTEARVRAEGAPLGPGSLLWSIAGDARGLIPGTAAGLLQMMLPGLGAGVTDHSNFFDDPYDRIFRSIPYIWGSIFSEADEADGRGREIRDFHTEIKGADDQGRRYHALDPEVFWRVHRSYLVNINRIKEVIPWFKSSYQLRMEDKKGTEIPVSRVQTKRLRALLKL